MTGELLWAVTDGPAGTNAVPAPEDRVDAGRLARHHRGGFWCSTRAGGCGGRLVLQVSGGGRPSFGHPGDARCPLPAADAGRAYEHLRYRPALTAWLAGHGHDARLERVADPGGRSGLHVVVDALGAVLEVQLAPLPDTVWRERDDHLRRRHRHVTWLYGPGAEAAAATEVAVRGLALALRRHHVGLSVGVRDVDDRTRWIRLAACRLTADGFEAPGTEEARALHAERTVHRQRAARRVRHRATGPPVPQLDLPFPA